MYHVVQSKLTAKVGLLIVAIACVGLLCVIYSIPLNVSTQVYEYIGKGIQADQNDSKHLLVNDSQQDTSIKINNTDQEEINIETANEAHKSSMKYILQWGPTASPFDMMGEGQSAFKKYACKYTNCFVTDNKQYFPDLTQFDAVAFSGKYMPQSNSLPTKRSEKQKYIFAATESAHNYRVCDSVYDGYFNWTWTYKLDSEARWAYVTIYDLEGNFAGPKIDMKWPQLKPINDKLKTELSSKNKVAAWFVSHCSTLSKRESFVRDLQRVAEKTYGWTVDVYGPCGKLRCPRSRADECFGALQRDYYFYLSFENSFAEDYVTEKLVNALNHNAVPVVYGAANYSRQVQFKLPSFRLSSEMAIK